jgi:hypothetical protein
MRTTCILASLLLLLSFGTAFGSSEVFFKDGTKEAGDSVWLEGDKVFLSKAKELYEFSADEVQMEETQKHNRIGKYADAASVERPAARKNTTATVAGEKASTSPSKNSRHVAGAPPTAQDVLKDENLHVLLPKGYKIDYQQRQGKMLITEMVPEGQNVNNWTEMVTVQVFFGGLPQVTPESFHKGLDAQWKRACQNAESQPIRKGTENGYPFTFWLEFCPENPATGKPEFTHVKAIQGTDSFYVVQKAWKYSPTEKEVGTWSKFMSTVKVIDPRIKRN